MEGVGNQVSIVGSVAWGPGRRQEGTRAWGGGCMLASSRCASAPWVFILLFCTRDSAGTALGNQKRTFWIRGSSQPSSRSELGKLSGAVGRRAGKREKRAGPGSGAREGTHIFLAFLDCRERERELYGPKKRGPKPKTFLLKVTWLSPSSPLLGPQPGRSTGPAREGQLRRCLGGRLFQRGPSWAEGGCESLTKSLAAGRSQRGLGVG